MSFECEQQPATFRRHPLEVDRVIAFDLDGVLEMTAMYERAQNIMMLGLYGLISFAGDHEPIKDKEFANSIEDQMEKAYFESSGDPIKHYQILLGRQALGPEFQERHTFVVNAAKSLIVPEVGAVDLLNDLAVDNRTGVALHTSRDRSIVTPDLLPGVVLEPGEGPRREGYFDLTITADDVGITDDGERRLKPDTAGLEIIAKYYNNIAYDRMTMIGDRASDLIPAVQLGIRAIGFASGYMRLRRDILWSAGAHHVVESHAELRNILFP